LIDVSNSHGIDAAVPSDENTANQLVDFSLAVTSGLKKQGRRLWL
jgi:hypothetical protein